MPLDDSSIINPDLVPKLFVHEGTGQVRTPLLVAALVCGAQCILAASIFFLLGGPSHKPYFLLPVNTPDPRKDGRCEGGVESYVNCGLRRGITCAMLAIVILCIVRVARNTWLGLWERRRI
ncbi:hypothetical protein HD806DRAFT_533308 [Xylariaceae sp. AK1471]|nr:hypothetical protein HD806DRAFT_533308 [Xylariaceae sp. AK1471]